jgi:glycosyltransferase involved in cell wall biosynthesis
MLRLYELQGQRLQLLHRYDAIATHSEYMLNELRRQGLAAERVRNFPYFVNPSNNTQTDALYFERKGELSINPSPWRLLFSGRMESLKGAHLFLAALPQVMANLERPVSVTFAGEGSERGKLERQAARLCGSYPGLAIEFTGWVNRNELEPLLTHCDLLVTPSLWPEPFGLVGPEAGLYGVPVAAFAVGGIPDWLQEGINGALAPGNPPTPDGLAAAIVRCLHDPAIHARLRRGAVEIAQQFNLKEHLESLLDIFEYAIEHRRREIRSEAVP